MKARERIKTGWLIAVGLITGLCSAEVRGASLNAGAAIIDITPTNLPIRTAGNLTLTVVSNIHDHLYSRALVLKDDGSTYLVIVVVDSCMIAREDLDKAKEGVSGFIPPENILICSTHT